MKHLSQIDRTRWNQCVQSSPQGRIYAEDWYLDIVSEGKWNALVLGDYEAVMPLPFHRKAILLPAIFQPLLCQQLGVFSKKILSEEIVKVFLKNVPSYYWKATLSLNDGTPMLQNFDKWTCTSRVNLVLSLSEPYEKIKTGYSDNLKRCLKKGDKNFTYSEDFDCQLFLKKVEEYLSVKENHIPPKVYTLAKKITAEAVKRDKGFLATLLTKEGDLAAGIFYLNDGKRLINLLNVTTPAGREGYAMHVLTDMVIEKFSNQNILMDFEGSSIESIARFYKSFGGKEANYQLLIK